jgi:uncharacterized membrane protein
MICESIRYGWSKARSLVWTFLPAVLILLAESCIPSWNTRSNGAWTLRFWWFDMGLPSRPIGAAITILDIAGWILSIWVMTGVIDCSVKVARGETVAARDLFGAWRSVWRYIVNSLLCVLVVSLPTMLMLLPVIGLVTFGAAHIESAVLLDAVTISLCIVAGLAALAWGLRYALSGYYVVTQEAGPVEALRMSVKATAGHKRELFGLLLATAGIEILGTLCLVVGLLWALPTANIAWGAVFLKLAGQDRTSENRDPMGLGENWTREVTD